MKLQRKRGVGCKVGKLAPSNYPYRVIKARWQYSVQEEGKRNRIIKSLRAAAKFLGASVEELRSGFGRSDWQFRKGRMLQRIIHIPKTRIDKRKGSLK